MKGGKSKAATSKKDSKLSVKKGADKPKAKKAKAEKDPNKPKRPPSAFFVFMDEFRKQFKEKNPNNKQVSVVGKAGGDKWKTLSEAEKAPYVAKAAKLKTEYTKTMASYNKKQSQGASAKTATKAPAPEEDEESEKSKSEVEDDDEGSEEEEEEDDE